MAASSAAKSVTGRRRPNRLRRFWLGVAMALALVQPMAIRAAEPIKIGVVAPLTGPLADAGRYGVQGAKLAVEEVN